MFKSVLTSILLLGILTKSGYSQEIPKCNQHKIQQEFLEEHPELRNQIEQANAQLEMETAMRAGSGSEDLIIIPVVFHVIHDFGPENISDEQIFDAMEILNRDFRKMNADTATIIEPFADLAADINIEFRLAQLDPSGNCTKGITRIASELTYEGNGDMRDLIQWPRDQYMNVWVCNYASGAAGYTFTPGSVDNVFSQDNDGIVLKYDYTGSIGTSSVFRSRTLTHEVGHWLNLRHTWGPTNDPAMVENCQSDDNVGDTPLTIGWTSCNINGESCGTLDNVENYMDYSYCSKMFTSGQMERMRTAAMSGIADRNELSTIENLVETGVFDNTPLLCEADFTVNKQVICAGESISFSDESYNGVENWTWDFGDGEVLEGSDAEMMESPEHIYEEPGTYTVTLTVENDGSTETETRTEYIHVLPSASMEAPLVEGFEEAFPDEKWFVTGDGDNIIWEVTSDAAYSGNQSIYLNNRNADPGQFDWLISNTIDATDTSGIRISFRYAYANRFEPTDDDFRFYVSGDCGENWVLKNFERGDINMPTADLTPGSFVPSGQDEWEYIEVEVNDSTLLTENFMMRFRFISAGGNNIYIDDINMSSQYVGIEEISESVVDWNVYPNPAGEVARVVLGVKTAGQFNIHVRDITGRKVMDLHNSNLAAGEHQIEVPVNELQNGIYMIVLQNGNERSTKRLLVRH